ncbi:MULTISPECIES: PPC domain-containing DNA-binding protein [Nonomuraea]|jgi:predicted DNA-binding protein with PD1-like motif|uniref:DNA-binding protein n=1 Tax=Nonomuraea ferruginea TaxID=46174 RepID=A0ABT4T299_9ACTN|nr:MULTISPECIES: PPC domain-containing DNA-binding protein [Nonomuraea]MDA0643250.1 DNA-binding protein [Nonomuraea ferruginea]TXK39524.1 DNA-binding protein [Nonomuraea sp. C10]
MKSRVLTSSDGVSVHAIIMDKGDEAMAELQRWAEEHEVTAASLTAIGAFSGATLGYFDPERGGYLRIPVREQVEVLSLTGDIAVADGRPQIHAHAVVGLRDGATRGGHLLEATVWPTLEVIVRESPVWLRKRHDPETGLCLIDLPSSG